MKSLVIGIAGGSASGKTTVTNKILEHLDRTRVVVIQHDSYYKDVSTFAGLRSLRNRTSPIITLIGI